MKIKDFLLLEKVKTPFNKTERDKNNPDVPKWFTDLSGKAQREYIKQHKSTDRKPTKPEGGAGAELDGNKKSKVKKVIGGGEGKSREELEKVNTKKKEKINKLEKKMGLKPGEVPGEKSEKDIKPEKEKDTKIKKTLDKKIPGSDIDGKKEKGTETTEPKQKTGTTGTGPEAAQPAEKGQIAKPTKMKQALTKPSGKTQVGLKPGEGGYATEMEKGFVDRINNDTDGMGEHSDEMNAHTQHIFDDLVAKGQLDKKGKYEAVQTAGNKTFTLTGDWSKYGATNNEPKTDVIIKHSKGEYRCTVKMGASTQLMSGKGNEALATLQAGAKEAKTSIEKMPEFKQLSKHLVRMTEKHVFPKEFGVGLKAGEKWAVEFDKMNKEATNLLNGILNKNDDLKREMVKEALTGNAKFGKDSPATATHLMIIDANQNGKGNQLLPITDTVVDEIAKNVKWKINVKSDAEKVGGQRTGNQVGRVVLRAYYQHATKEGIELPETELLMEKKLKKVSKEKLQKAIEEYLSGGMENVLDFLGASIDVEHEKINWVEIGKNVEAKMKKGVDARPAMSGIKDAFKKKGLKVESKFQKALTETSSIYGISSGIPDIEYNKMHAVKGKIFYKVIGNMVHFKTEGDKHNLDANVPKTDFFAPRGTLQQFLNQKYTAHQI